jgi:periplasmic copper chaperone A
MQSFHPVRGRRALLAGALLTIVVAAPAPALGHVTIPDGAAVPSGSSSVIHLRVPHGCEGAATDTLEVQLPDGIVSAQPESVPGWTLEVEMVPSEPYDEFGTERTERVGVIRWSGGDLPDAAFFDFGIRARFVLEPGTTVAIPVVQRCGDVEVAWIAPTNGGEAEPEHPAPLIGIGDPLPEATED